MAYEFGAFEHISAVRATAALMLVTCFIITFEYLSKLVDQLQEEYAYFHNMIQRLFKELTIMGIVSFIVVMYETSAGPSPSGDGAHQTNDQHEWLQAVDTVHIMLFFMALFYVLHGFLLIIISILITSEYSKFHRINLNDVIDMVVKLSDWQKYVYKSNYIFASNARELVEFHMLKKFFNETYFYSDEFDFAAYLAGCFHAYCIELLDVGIFTWITVSIIGAINLARVEAFRGVNDCTDTEHGEDADCTGYHLSVFLFSGVLVSFIATVVTAVSRLYEVRLIRQTGAKVNDEYVGYLAAENIKTTEERVPRMSVVDLKENIQIIKDKELQKIPVMNASMQATWQRLSCAKKLNKIREGVLSRRRRSKSSNSVSPDDDPFAEADAAMAMTNLRFAFKSPGKPLTQQQALIDSPMKSKKAPRESVFDAAFNKSQDIRRLPSRRIRRNDVSEIFLFKNRHLFYRGIELVVMLNCLYMALWVTNFITVAYESGRPVMWQIFIIMPIIYTFGCLSVLVKTSSKMLAVEELNIEVIGRMVEEEEMTRGIIADLRLKILALVDDIGDDNKSRQAMVEELFAHIDSDQSGQITKRELRIFLEALHLHFSNSKLNRLFKTVDSDHDGFIMKYELAAILFPDDESVRGLLFEERPSGRDEKTDNEPIHSPFHQRGGDGKNDDASSRGIDSPPSRRPVEHSREIVDDEEETGMELALGDDAIALADPYTPQLDTSTKYRSLSNKDFV